jgi:hypothetical protein
MRDVHAVQHEILLSTCAPFHVEPHSRFSKNAFIADNGRMFTTRAISRFAIILSLYCFTRLVERQQGKARLGAPGWAGEKNVQGASWRAGVGG